MDTQATQEGPDLGQGIDEASIPETGMLLGHCGGEAVLLIRRGERFVAVGASCPHYGAPLVEGALVGDELHCPWHHAAFNLETGAASAPSLNPLPCWNIERRGGQIFVTSRKSLPKPRPASNGVRRIVIVGGGAAGNAAAETLRREGFDGELTVLSADLDLPYDKPNLSKDFLAGNAQEEWIPLRSEDFYREEAIDFKLGTRVVRIDPAAGRLMTSTNETFAFDRCLLATGTVPRRLSVVGSELPHVHYLRTLSDCLRLIARLGQSRAAVVVGSGFIGLEVAASLRARGLAVRIVTPDVAPLVRVVGPELGAFFRKMHEDNGVIFHLGRQVAHIAQDSVTLDDGTNLKADLVVVGIGVQSELAMAEAAGIRLAGGGVEVSRQLETNVSGIYAAGDIAYWPEPRSGSRARIEHWAVAGRQGQVAARNMLGRGEDYRVVPFFWTMQFGTGLSYVGHAPAWDETRVSGSIAACDATVAFLTRGRVLAVATLGRESVSLEAEAALADNDDKRLLALLTGVKG